MQINHRILFKFPFWQIIFDNMPTTDIHKIKTIFSIYSHKIDEYLYRRFLKTINQRFIDMFGEDAPLFKKELIKNNAVISGSFLIQCILEEDWKTDVDIYVPIHKMDNLQDDNQFTNLENFLYERMNFAGYSASCRYGDDLGNKINWVRDYSFVADNSFKRANLGGKSDTRRDKTKPKTVRTARKATRNKSQKRSYRKNKANNSSKKGTR